ncbi:MULTISPECIES: hypothetical protein [Nostoc]|uniref:Uncharacterized protein n=2 Tax=Nostoc TaxID=1177 RepID=A0ABR8I5M2_9NOSO|nr:MULTISPECIES: hypothetical protein [Nostoc]MBD2561096.1 hypothetical protein [Nostoc linckia FACHB-391]MBD2646091.1 hypothetical protein [Nostoc foliaceum FACHB-393]
MKTATAIATALTLLSLSTVPALAATATKYQVKGQNAYASFYQSDDCSYTYVSVYGFDSVTKSGPGAPISQTGGYLDYSSYNYCTGAQFYGGGFTENIPFTSNKLNSATLNGTFTVYDYYSETSKTATVNLTWTGTGDTYRGKSNSRYQGPGYSSIYRSSGSSRDAQVSGTVTLDGTNLIANMTSYGSLSTSSNGSLEIIK